MSDDEALVVGLKYCGGCRAEYDRVALVKQIRRQLNGKVRFVRHDSPDVQIVLVMDGCKTACADLSSVGDRAVWTITSPDDAKGFVKAVLSVRLWNPI